MENGEVREPVMLKPTLKPDYHFVVQREIQKQKIRSVY